VRVNAVAAYLSIHLNMNPLEYSASFPAGKFMFKFKCKFKYQR